MKSKKNKNDIFIKNLKNDLIKKKPNLFYSFFPSSRYSFKFNNLKKFQKFETVVLIGMGGSALGSKAIYSFLRHKIKKKFIFMDNLDKNFFINLKTNFNLKKTLFLVISKSGNTLETIVNFSCIKSFIKKTNTILISENKNNILFNFAKKNKFTFVSHNPFIGGRYSVFSEVGMLPAHLMGLNPNNFKKNIPKLLNNNKVLKDTFKSLFKVKKFKNLILLNYVPELSDFLFWCQQLFAESLGKNNKGFIPIISNAPMDHHSLLQLYLGGPKDKFFYIFSSDIKKNKKIKCKFLGKDINFLNNKDFDEVKNSQKEAIKTVFREKKIPFREIKIKEFNEDTLGRLFISFIMETIALGKILKVNPYDQPAVEQVKILTRRLLASKKSTKKNF